MLCQCFFVGGYDVFSGTNCRCHVRSGWLFAAHDLDDDVVAVIAKYRFGIGCQEIGGYAISLTFDISD